MFWITIDFTEANLIFCHTIFYRNSKSAYQKNFSRLLYQWVHAHHSTVYCTWSKTVSGVISIRSIVLYMKQDSFISINNQGKDETKDNNKVLVLRSPTNTWLQVGLAYVPLHTLTQSDIVGGVAEVGLLNNRHQEVLDRIGVNRMTVGMVVRSPSRVLLVVNAHCTHVTSSTVVRIRSNTVIHSFTVAVEETKEPANVPPCLSVPLQIVVVALKQAIGHPPSRRSW